MIMMSNNDINDMIIMKMNDNNNNNNDNDKW